MMINNKTYQTNSLTAIVYPNNLVKLNIYNYYKSKYGGYSRELLSSKIAIPTKEFTFDYVKSKVDEVYSSFSNDQIHELLNKIS